MSDKNNKTLKPSWRRVKFGDVVRLSKARSQDPLADGFDRYVGMEHLEPGDLRIRRWGNVADGVTFTSVFQPGQVLFGKRRAYQRKVAVADFSGVCSGDIYVLETKGAQVLLPELLPFICQTDAFFDHAVGTSAGSLSPRTNWTSLAMRRLMDTRVLRGSAAVDLGQVSEFARAFDVEGEEGSAIPPLPRFFSQALFHGVNEDHYAISLEFVGEAPQGGWHVSHLKRRLMDDSEWKVLKTNLRVELRLPCDGPPPSVLTVEWSGGQNVAEWPLNVVAPESLPAPTELQGLSLAALLDLLSSARPLNEALRAWLRQQPNDDDSEVEQAVELIDPHAKVDTSGFLVKRVQRACWAMRELRTRLEQPVLSSSAMAWRISGPVGARAVLEAMRRQCDPALPDEWAFLLCELSREIGAVLLKGAVGRTADPDVAHLLADFQADLSQMLVEAQKGCSSPMRGYIANALTWQPEHIQEGTCHAVA